MKDLEKSVIFMNKKIEQSERVANSSTLILSGKKFKNFEEVESKELLTEVVKYLTALGIGVDFYDIVTVEASKEEEDNALKIVFTNRRQGKTIYFLSICTLFAKINFFSPDCL